MQSTGGRPSSSVNGVWGALDFEDFLDFFFFFFFADAGGSSAASTPLEVGDVCPERVIGVDISGGGIFSKSVCNCRSEQPFIMEIPCRDIV